MWYKGKIRRIKRIEREISRNHLKIDYGLKVNHQSISFSKVKIGRIYSNQKIADEAQLLIIWIKAKELSFISIKIEAKRVEYWDK